MNQLLVSVVIPVFNGADFLPTALDHVFNQTYQRLQVIIVDDGSTDRTPEVLARYATQIEVQRQPNRGVGHARNTGIAASRGDYVAFLDQDDWWHRDKISRQVACFEQDGGVGLVHTGVDYFDQRSRAITKPLNPVARPELLQGDCFRRLLEENHVRNSSVMVRRRLLAEVGACDQAISGNTVQDYDLWLRLARVSRFAYLPESLTVIRLHQQQGTWDRRQMLGEEARLLERLRAREPSLTQGLRRRMAGLYDSLGVAHLDAGEARAARRAFRRSLSEQFTPRGAMLYLSTLLPASLRETLRQNRRQLGDAL
ncbi:MAG: glycosyltransferase family 2 protein [Pirellulales bacterium]|nr:glycosyltransferase family 2 protein [Pirellulales bacterium]